MPKNSFTATCRRGARRTVSGVTDGGNALAGVRVLVVEDDRSIGEQLTRGLARAGCQVVAVDTGAAALEALDTDLVLLDLGLPDVDGVQLCARMRARTGVPIIVVTARDGEAARVAALDTGADDYVAKPFGFAELLARMRAVLRRADRSETPVVRHGPLTVDVAGRRVEVDGRQVALTAKEFDILACLVTEPDRVVSREEIFDRAWDEHWYGPTRVLDVHMTSLRRKLGDPSLIETVYGRGFRLKAP
jgi:DNA-binding response OmpR family regulator